MEKKIFILSLSFVITVVSSQRPYYAPNPVRYPDVADRFKTPQNTANADIDVNNRNRDDGMDGTTSSTTTIRIPIDARGDTDLVNRINQWPADHRPFWYINAEAIERYRGQQFPNNQNGNQFDVPVRSSFLPDNQNQANQGSFNAFNAPPPRSPFLPSRP